LGLLDYLTKAHNEELARQLLQTERKNAYQASMLEEAVALTQDEDLPHKLARHILKLELFDTLKLMLNGSNSLHDAYRLLIKETERFGDKDYIDYLPEGKNQANFIYHYYPEAKPHPFYCKYRGGLLSHVPTLMGLAPAKVEETECVTKGDANCLYQVSWEKQPFTSSLLKGTLSGGIIGGTLAIMGNLLIKGIGLGQLLLIFLIPLFTGLLTGHFVDLYRQEQRKNKLISRQQKLLRKKDQLLGERQEEIQAIATELSQKDRLDLEELNQLNERLNQMNYELLQRNVKILQEHEELRNRQEHEYSMARSIQKSILLDEEEFNHKSWALQGSLAYQPAEQHIGGDFYDYLEDQGRTYILLGDVSGHGLGAVQVVHSALSYFRSIGKKRCPEKLMKILNKFLQKDLRKLTSYATAIYCVIQDDALHYINAAQRGGFVYKPREQRFVPLTSINRPLGSAISDNRFFRKQSIPLEPGDLIVIYTDGLVEANSGAEEFGSHRIEQIVRSHYQAAETGHYPHPHQVKEALLQGVENFQESGQADDLTLLVLKY